MTLLVVLSISAKGTSVNSTVVGSNAEFLTLILLSPARNSSSMSYSPPKSPKLTVHPLRATSSRLKFSCRTDSYLSKPDEKPNSYGYFKLSSPAFNTPHEDSLAELAANTSLSYTFEKIFWRTVGFMSLTDAM